MIFKMTEVAGHKAGRSRVRFAVVELNHCGGGAEVPAQAQGYAKIGKNGGFSGVLEPVSESQGLVII